METSAALDRVIRRIESEICRCGSCLVSHQELLVICDGAVDDSKRFECIRDLAGRHQWAFELRGRMTWVTFKKWPAHELDNQKSESSFEMENGEKRATGNPESGEAGKSLLEGARGGEVHWPSSTEGWNSPEKCAGK